MRRPSVIARTFAVLCALLQMAMPGVVSVADAWRDGASAPGGRSRIEAHSESHCVALGTDACALCEYLTDGALPPSDAAAPLAMVRAALVAPTASAYAAFRIAGTTARPRAPPVG
jgi:hypothetical protein